MVRLARGLKQGESVDWLPGPGGQSGVMAPLVWNVEAKGSKTRAEPPFALKPAVHTSIV